jgi:hypothetical protein
VLAACADGKKRREKGSSGTGVELPFYTGAAGVGDGPTEAPHDRGKRGGGVQRSKGGGGGF